MTTIQERVESGAAWLDEHRPGWVDRINLDRLIMSSKCGCILGQVDGDYFETIKAFNVDAERAEEAAVLLGFQASHEGTYGYGELEDAWRDHITARRAAA